MISKISQLWLKMSWKRKGTIQIKQKKNRGKFEIKKKSNLLDYMI